MRREHFTLDVADVDWIETDGEPKKPSVTIDFDGSGPDLESRLTGPDGELLAGEETDVALRLQGPVESGASGVVSVTDRLTGDFVLELNVDADDVITFIRAARGYGERSNDDEGRYEVTIRVEGEELLTYEKRTFLVYDDEGSLLRQHSLIPGGVEL
ncbi:DUF5793 family protein [Halovivax gelatinilyticus]|uniref:DUF5793 family protein n=1 Tax=Halovivax gelatinilyticus TaxID=2961597 RepID=UPI0020CA7EA3|nr:DUF5793 family protein [Halovivax gelatinilyticus]